MAAITTEIAALGSSRTLGTAGKVAPKPRRNEDRTEDRAGLQAGGIQDEQPVFSTRGIALAAAEPIRDAGTAADLIALARTQLLGQADSGALAPAPQDRSGILDLLR